MKPVKQWRGNRGAVVLQLFDNGSLVKFERAKDRLTILRKMAHAIDASMMDEAIALGAKTLFISEDSQKIVWEAELEKVMPLSQVRNICGIRRRCFDLRRFIIVKGIENAPSWYVNRPVESKPNPEPRGEQVVMFAPTAGEIRLHYETQGGR